MAFERGGGGTTVRARLLLGATALACLSAIGAVSISVASAQSLSGLASTEVGGDKQMLLEADTLVYDNDNETVTAAGNVRIDYDGNRLVSRRVVYNRKTGRIVAIGNVEIVNKDGTRIFSEEIDVTDDFKDGFVNALRVETIDKTYFAAESAERKGGTLTTFTNGVYTACEPCEDKPDSAPIWRIKAKKIIWNGESKVVRFEQPRFEFFGLPLAFLPAFEMADPTVKRKSGFLFPGIGLSNNLGTQVSIPYFFALSPTYDLTVTANGYTKQGFLGEAEWRQQFNNGSYSITAAGIYQNDPGAFDEGTVDRTVKGRWMVATEGSFKINPRWTFGWDVMAQSDKNFSSTYDIGRYGETYRTNEVYLTGLNDRNYFDLRFYRFRVQESSESSQQDDQQPWVLPSFDYSYTPDEPLAGGELDFDVNLQVLKRDELDYNPSAPAVRGIDGWSGRLTAEAEWKRNLVTPGGLMVTPVLNVRADGIGVDSSNASDAAIASMASRLSGQTYSFDGSTYDNVAADIRSSYFRAMATAGMEVRWPVMFSTTSASHVLEPIGQIFVRPDAAFNTTLGIPNEDAQSMVFDASSLFERDKFSGYDLMEGGTRANVGLRYSGDLGNDWTTSALFGQSYHLAGDNPFALPNLVNAGAYSGLETDVSDFVGMVSLGLPRGFAIYAGGRFDEDTFETRRGEVAASATLAFTKLAASYAFIQAQPLYGFENDRQEVALKGSAQFNENWSLFGSGTYELESETLVKSALGFRYGDECYVYSMTFSRKENTINKEVDYNVGFFMSFRTIGDIGTSIGEIDSTVSPDG